MARSAPRNRPWYFQLLSEPVKPPVLFLNKSFSRDVQKVVTVAAVEFSHLSAGMNGLHSYHVCQKILSLGCPQDGHGEMKSTWPGQVQNRADVCEREWKKEKKQQKFRLYFLLFFSTQMFPGLMKYPKQFPTPPNPLLGEVAAIFLVDPPFWCCASPRRPLPPQRLTHTLPLLRDAPGSEP